MRTALEAGIEPPPFDMDTPTDADTDADVLSTFGLKPQSAAFGQ